MKWSENIESILSIGICLKNVGVNNWALNKKQALYAVEELKKNGVPILGGDVYEKQYCKFIQNYDNWFCDKKEYEKDEDFLSRSIQIAFNYINSYNANDKTYFVIVPQLT